MAQIPDLIQIWPDIRATGLPDAEKHHSCSLHAIVVLPGACGVLAL
jgi:hypothetical protein